MIFARYLLLVAIFFATISSIFCKVLIFLTFSLEVSRFFQKQECEGANLNPSDKLRIGVKHRPDECEMKSQQGDLLSMHYDGFIGLQLYQHNTSSNISIHRNSHIFNYLSITTRNICLQGTCIHPVRRLIHQGRGGSHLSSLQEEGM